MTKTNISSLQQYLQQQPPLNVESQGFEYLGDGRVLLSLETESGAVVTVAMSAGALMRATNAAVALVNDNLADFLAEIRKSR
jgi:hypothetical protein